MDNNNCKDIYGINFNEFNEVLSRNPEKNKVLAEFLKPINDWELGNIGFLASYNGRFFDGGYAKPSWEKTRYRDYYQESKNNILKQIDNLKDVEFQVNDYKSFTNIVGAVIYCDPPYENTKSYKNSTNFNHEEFWDFMRELSKDNIVFISELKAPDDFKPIWEKEVSRSIKVSGKSKAQEKLFVYNHKN